MTLSSHLPRPRKKIHGLICMGSRKEPYGRGTRLLDTVGVQAVPS